MNKHISIILLALGVLLAGCTKPVEEILTLSRTSYTTGYDGGKVSLNVTHSGDYTVTIEDGASSWISAEPNGAEKNTLIVTVAPNDTYNERKGRVAVRMGSLTEYFEVSQAQKNAVVVSDTEFRFDCEGGNFTVKVGSNVDYKVSIDAPWITQTNTKAYEEKELVFNCAANMDADDRTATITFTSGHLNESVTVTQEGRTKEYRLRIFHENMSFQIPEFAGSVISGSIAWGDGSKVDFTQSARHDYVSLQEYCVDIVVSAGLDEQIVTLKDVVGVKNIDLTGM